MIKLFQLQIKKPKVISAQKCLLLIGFLIFSENLKASEASPAYEAGLIIPWKFVEQSINPQTGFSTSSYQTSFSNIGFAINGVPFVLPSLQMESLIHLKPTQAQDQETVWETDQLALKFKVGAFRVQKDIEQIVSGIRVIVHLQAECSSFVLNQPKAHTQLTWHWSVSGGQVKADLKNFNLDWDANSWQISEINCNGPIGFADVIQNELRAQLAQAEPLIPFIKTALQRSINEQMNSRLSNWKKPQWIQTQNQAFNVELTDTQILSSNGFLLKGLLRFDIPSPNEKVVSLNLNESQIPKDLSQPTLLFSAAAMKSMIQQRSLSTVSRFNLNQISGFQRILKSRFLQFFVWPDLRHFAKNSTFELVSGLASSPKIQFGNSSNLSIQAEILSKILAPRDGTIQNYVEIRSQLASELQYSVIEGAVILQFLNPQLQFSSNFDKDYLKRYKPSPYLPDSIIKKAASQVLSIKSGPINLPSISLTNSIKLQADSLRQNDPDLFLLEFKTTGK